MKKVIDSTKNEKDVFLAVKSALQSVGKIKSDNSTSLIINGSSRYGLQSVDVAIRITATVAGCEIVIEAKSDDVWEKGAKSVLEKLIPVIETNVNMLSSKAKNNVVTSEATSITSNSRTVQHTTAKTIEPNTTEGFQSKIFRFDSEVVVDVQEEKLIVRADNGNGSIDSYNLDNVSYISHNEPRLSILGMVSRPLLGGLLTSFILLFFVKDEWGALFFEAGFKDVFFLWLSIAIAVVSVLLSAFIWMSFSLDLFLETGLYERVVVNLFSNRGYAVTIGNKGGKNINFFVFDTELYKIKNLDIKVQELKSHIGVRKPDPVLNVTIPTSSNLDELKKLGELFQNGILTQAEFDMKKAELLGL